MANHHDEWDRERDYPRDRREYDRGYEERVRHEGHGHRSSDYGSHAGWGGQGFSQGSFGNYGSQGERLYNQYGGQGYGAQSGYVNRETGGGMSTYSGPRGSREGYGQGTENWGRERWGGEDRDPGWGSERESWGRDRDWRGDRDWRESERRLGGREAGWGGYGAYDRERYSSGPSQNEWRDGPSQGEWAGGSVIERGSGAWSGNTGSSNMGWSGSGSREWSENRSGRFMGRGPKGYQRSDERIREDVCEALTRHPGVDASDIEIEVRGGEVTLKGAVDERYAKRMAEDCAEQVSGVRQVHNQLRVEQRQSQGQTGSSRSGLGSVSPTADPSQSQRQSDLTGALKR